MPSQTADEAGIPVLRGAHYRRGNRVVGAGPAFLGAGDWRTTLFLAFKF